MSTPLRAEITTNSLRDTERVAAKVASHVAAPAVLLLEGDIGAGKSAFARAFLRAIGVTDQDIPSPTFTLVQTYESSTGTLWHSDLYRLTDPDEVDELGLLDAFETSVCLVEWPDRLADACPQDALVFRLTPGTHDDARNITLTSTNTRWRSLFKALS